MSRLQSVNLEESNPSVREMKDKMYIIAKRVIDEWVQKMKNKLDKLWEIAISHKERQNAIKRRNSVDRSVPVIPEVNVPTVHTMTTKKPDVIPVTTTPPLTITQTNALPDISDTPEIPTSSHNDGPTQLTIEPAITPPISVTDPAAPIVVSSAQEPSTSDAPTSGIIEDILPKKMMLLKQQV